MDMYAYMHIYICYTHVYAYVDAYTYTYVCIHVCVYRIPGMGWLRLVGSLKLQVSFAKEPYKRDDILQKRPIILCMHMLMHTHTCIPYVGWLQSAGSFKL